MLSLLTPLTFIIALWASCTIAVPFASATQGEYLVAFLNEDNCIGTSVQDFRCFGVSCEGTPAPVPCTPLDDGENSVTWNFPEQDWQISIFSDAYCKDVVEIHRGGDAVDHNKFLCRKLEHTTYKNYITITPHHAHDD